MLPLALARFSRTGLCWMVIVGWVCSASMILLVAVDAVPSDEAEIVLDAFRQGILLAHPEWPLPMRAALLAGIICAGMPADMVRVAWGVPTRTSGGEGPGRTLIWYYDGRPSVTERMIGKGRHDAGSGEWTVSFVNGQVVGWTD
jgi:hypothetical protein